MKRMNCRAIKFRVLTCVSCEKNDPLSLKIGFLFIVKSKSLGFNECNCHLLPILIRVNLEMMTLMATIVVICYWDLFNGLICVKEVVKAIK